MHWSLLPAGSCQSSARFPNCLQIDQTGPHQTGLHIWLAPLAPLVPLALAPLAPLASLALAPLGPLTPLAPLVPHAPLAPFVLICILKDDWMLHVTPFQNLNLDQSDPCKIGLLIIKVPNVCPQISCTSNSMNKLTLMSQQKGYTHPEEII